MLRMPGTSYRGELPPLTPDEIAIRDEIKNHVTYLAETLGERNIWHPDNYLAAEKYIAASLEQTKLSVTVQEYPMQKLISKNIIAEKIGSNKPEEMIVIGAHYDSVFGAPGADDNASGVAGILAIAKRLAKINLSRTFKIVAFANEEPPFFYSKKMGSWHYARLLKNQNAKVVAMFSIESIGFYLAEKFTQRYPMPFSFFYPDTADFIGFAGNIASRKLVHRSIELFRQTTKFPSEGISTFSWIPGVGWSDQLSFWKHGFPAVMITDTALFRNPFYHTSEDLPHTLDYDRTARVVSGVIKMLVELDGD